MKSLVLLLCLAQLWGCHSAPHNPGLGYRQPNCDDPEVEEAALAAVEYINKHRLQGYKHTLNQIDKVKVWTRVSEIAVCELKGPVCGAQPAVSKDDMSQHQGNCKGVTSLISSQEQEWGRQRAPEETFSIVAMGLKEGAGRGLGRCVGGKESLRIIF